MLYACDYHQVKELILLVLFVGGFFVGVPLAAIIGLVMIELRKAKQTGVDVDAIIDDARRRAYRRGRDGI
jgi:hypothetical protein